MRARIAVTISFLLTICLWTVPSFGSLSSEMTVGWSWDQVSFHPVGSGEVEVRVEEAMLQLTAPGEPALPAYLVRVQAPDGARVASVSIMGEVTSVRDLAAPITPVLQDAPSIAGGPYRVERLTSAYDVPSFPAERVQSLGIGLRRGTAWARFAVYPLVLEDGKRVRLLESGTLLIEWEYDAAVPIPFKSLRESSAGTESGSDGNRTLRADASAITEKPALESQPVDYVILTTNALESAVAALALWKNQSGTPAVTRTVEWVYQNYTEGADDQERIRNFLRDAYRYWGAKWLLIVGGPDQVPIRTIRSLAYTFSDPNGVDIITDLYYACLDGTWNADGDQYFGEAVRTVPPVNAGDQVDFDAELDVGRIPATTPGEVTTWLQKYTKYVQNPVTDGYLDKILLLGEVLFDSGWTRALYPPCGRSPGGCPESCNMCVYQDGASDCVRVAEIIEDSDFEMDLIELYEWFEYWNIQGRPDAALEKKSTVVSNINNGVGILHHVGHGSQDRMSIGTLGGTDGLGRYVMEDARMMANGDRVGFAYSINCNSGAINFDCIAEAMLFTQNGGMVSYIGSSNLDFPTAARGYMSGFYQKIFSQEAQTVGEAHYSTIAAQMAGVPTSENFQRFLAFSLIHLGDPQMGIWLGTPNRLSVLAGTSITLGQTDLEVQVVSGNPPVPVPGATVCAYKINDTYAVGTTDGDGTVILPFRPTSTGSFRITAKHPRHAPYTENSTRLVNPPNTGTASVSVGGLLVNDAEGANTAGNDNSRFEGGETVNLDVTLQNGGDVPIDGITLRLAVGPLDPLDYSELIEIVKDTHEGAAVSASATARIPGAFRVRLKPNIGIAPDYYQNGDRLPFVATITVETGKATEDFEVPLMCYRPILALEQSTLVEVAGTEVTPDGRPETGETMLWTPVFRNLGTGSAESLVGTLEAIQGADINTDTAPFEAGDQGDLIAAETPFEFDVANGFLLRLRLTVRSSRDAGRKYAEQEIEFYPPAAPVFPSETPLRSTKDAVAVTWAAPLDSDVQGYVLDRSLSGQNTFIRIHSGLIRNIRYLFDDGLAPLTRYDYRVAAIDMSGNQGAYSELASATTTPGAMPGYPFGLQAFVEWACPAIEDIDAGGPNDQYEIFGAADVMYGLRSTGGEIRDGDGVSSTLGIWSSQGAGFWSKPALADIDGDGVMDLVGAGRYTTGSSGTAYLHVWDAAGTHKWERQLFGNSHPPSSPVIANIDGDDQSEIVVQHMGHLYAWNHDGSPVVAANTDGLLAFVGGDPLAAAPYTISSPAVADLDGNDNGKDEVVVGVLTNATNKMAHLVVVDGDGTILAQKNLQEVSQSADSSPSLADVDGDGVYEIFIATKDYLWALSYNAATMVIEPEASWGPTGRFAIDALPDNWVQPTPAIGDVNGDGQLDVVIGAGLGQLLAVDGRYGVALDGFPYQLVATGKKVGSPILVQLDSDTPAEIIVGDNDNTVHALDVQTLETVPGFPYYIGGRIQHGLNYWDTDRNGHPNLIIQADTNPYIYALDISNVDFPSTHELAMQFNPWTNFRHDARNTGTLPNEVMTPVILIDLAARVEAGAAVLQWNVPVEPAVFEIERQDSDGVWRLRLEAPASSLRGESGYHFEDSAEAGRYLYRVIGRDAAGQETYRSVEVAVTIEPLRLRLLAVVPNPFNPRTSIHVETPGGAIVLEIIDLSGRKVRTLTNGSMPPGAHELVWDGRDDQGRDVGSGVYMSRLLGAAGKESRKMVLLR